MDYSVAVELGLRNVRPSMARIQFGHMTNHQWISYEVDDVVIPGKSQFAAKLTDQAEEFYLSPVMDEVTYGQLLKIADDAIVARNDFHHVFFEGVRFASTDSEAEVATYTMSFGS